MLDFSTLWYFSTAQKKKQALFCFFSYFFVLVYFFCENAQPNDGKSFSEFLRLHVSFCSVCGNPQAVFVFTEGFARGRRRRPCTKAVKEARKPQPRRTFLCRKAKIPKKAAAFCHTRRFAPRQGGKIRRRQTAKKPKASPILKSACKTDEKL